MKDGLLSNIKAIRTPGRGVNRLAVLIVAFIFIVIAFSNSFAGLFTGQMSVINTPQAVFEQGMGYLLSGNNEMAYESFSLLPDNR